MLSRDEYLEADALALAELVRSGAITASELLEIAIQEIERLNPRLNAIVSTNLEQARDTAKAPHSTGGFMGVPFAVKDINVDVAGMRTTHACRFFQDAPIAAKDSALVKRWRESGLTLIGRSNTPEFATDFGCEPELFGPTHNPWQLSRTPGGSSGGAAAAVAAGMIPMAHASDSGGSIRVPAGCCGVFGFKPSAGVVATGSDIGPLVGGLNVDHVITRSVRDSAAMLLATAAPEPGMSGHWIAPDPGLLDQLDRAPTRLRIGVTSRAPSGHNADPETQEKLDQARALMETLGHLTMAFEWPEGIDTMAPATTFWASELAHLIEQRATSLGRGPTADELGPVTRWAWELAQSENALRVVQARIEVTDIRRKMQAAMNGFDAVMTPITTCPPLPTGKLTELAEQDSAAWEELAFGFAPYTEIFNVTGQPAMSVPLYMGQAGLPIGIQIAANPGQDAMLLRLARQLETAAPWGERRPPDT